MQYCVRCNVVILLEQIMVDEYGSNPVPWYYHLICIFPVQRIKRINVWSSVCLMLMILLICVDVNQILTLFCCVLRSLSADCVDDIRTAVPVKHWSVSRAPVESSALEQILDPSCSI